ncbi:MAG: signal recognition particle protein Srp19, partial [Saccharolobus sp.]
MSLRELKDEGRVVIWPSYFLSPTRSKGRRVSKILYKITVDDIIDVSKSLGLEP